VSGFCRYLFALTSSQLDCARSAAEYATLAARFDGARILAEVMTNIFRLPGRNVADLLGELERIARALDASIHRDPIDTLLCPHFDNM
jgi:hypothetical protein